MPSVASASAHADQDVSATPGSPVLEKALGRSPRARLGRNARLRSESAFREAFQKEGLPTRTLVLWVRSAPDANRRVGVVASKRTFRLAVDRNRAKRLLREAFRLQRHRIQDGADFVLLARRAILDVRRQRVEADLLHALSRARLLLP